ncbi:MAG: acetoacetate decarboxylase family protein [Acidimicrobiia bacterium]|nr:acetoacetate decarboxylase family protein [Acidimicrobiia bacterium]
MSNELLFDAVGGVEAEWRDRKVNLPVRYFEASNFTLSFRTPLDVVRSLLPGVIHPLRWGRSEAVTAIVFNDFPKSDIGGYQEVMIGFPVSIEKQALPYLGLRSFAKQSGAVFVHQMILDDQFAIDLGVDISGYPKRMGDIELDFDSFMVHCRWREDGEEVLTITAPRPTPEPVDKRDRTDLITTKNGYVLRSQFVGYTGREGQVGAESIEVEFGAHARSDELRSLMQGKCLGGSLVLDRQLTLSQPLEAWR